MVEGEQDGGFRTRVKGKEGRRQSVQCAVFFLIQIRFHKDPHDCLIKRETQRGKRWREEAEAGGHDGIDK